MPTWRERRKVSASAIVALVLIACCIISYAVGIADGKRSLYPAISDLQACNDTLTKQVVDARSELDNRQALLGWTAKYIREKGEK